MWARESSSLRAPAGEAAEWLVESVTLHKCTLQGKALQPVQRFKADGWITGAPGSATNPLRLLPAQAALQEVPWTMRVHTGRRKGDTRGALLMVGSGTPRHVFQPEVSCRGGHRCNHLLLCRHASGGAFLSVAV